MVDVSVAHLVIAHMTIGFFDLSPAQCDLVTDSPALPALSGSIPQPMEIIMSLLIGSIVPNFDADTYNPYRSIFLYFFNYFPFTHIYYLR